MLNKFHRSIFELIRDDDEDSLPAKIFDGVIIALILLNVAAVMIETFDGIPPSIMLVINHIEAISIVIFTIEYLLRLWTADLSYPNLPKSKARIKYIFSFMGVVDLLAILPFYIPFVMNVDLRILRTVRLLRLLRLLKVNHYSDALTTVFGVIKAKMTQLLSSMLVVMVLIIIASLLMYSLEHEAQPGVFKNAFSGFWWAVATLTTVGYGDIYPVTVLCRIMGALIAILGIGLVAIPTGIISAGFIENLSDQRDAAKLSAREPRHFCPYCGKNIEH